MLLLPPLKSSSKHGRWRSSLVLYPISMIFASDNPDHIAATVLFVLFQVGSDVNAISRLLHVCAGMISILVICM